MNNNQEILINSRYRVDGMIAEGGCGIVYLGTDIQDNNQVAIKLEDSQGAHRLLKHEAKAYQILAAGGTGIARVHFSGREGDYRVLVHDLLGPTLQDLFDRCGRRFSLKTVLMLADQLLERVEYLHSKMLIHRDIKPHNFLMGRGEVEGNLLYAVDFGMVSKFHASYVYSSLDGRGFCGTCRYTSISNHLGFEQSPKDDIEAVAYMLIYFARGFLPWQGVKGVKGVKCITREDQRKLVGLHKIWLTPEEICKGLPEEFARHLKYARSLDFDDKPSYAKLRRMYARLFAREGFRDDGIFDWDESGGKEESNDVVEEVDAPISSRLRKRNLPAQPDPASQAPPGNQQKAPKRRRRRA